MPWNAEGLLQRGHAEDLCRTWKLLSSFGDERACETADPLPGSLRPPMRPLGQAVRCWSGVGNEVLLGGGHVGPAQQRSTNKERLKSKLSFLLRYEPQRGGGRENLRHVACYNSYLDVCIINGPVGGPTAAVSTTIDSCSVQVHGERGLAIGRSGGLVLVPSTARGNRRKPKRLLLRRRRQQQQPAQLEKRVCGITHPAKAFPCLSP
ncbi:unnamed protein product [Arctogadus glacialis]